MDLHDDERRVVDPKTGGMKGQKLTQLSALDPLALIALGRVAGYGGMKYDRMNFLKGYDWSLSLDALLRHTMAFASGETHDPETGLNHMAHAAWHALALVSFSERGLGTDDRVSSLPSVRRTTRRPAVSHLSTMSSRPKGPVSDL